MGIRVILHHIVSNFILKILFSLTAMTLTIGIKPTMKIILKYPAIITTVTLDVIVFTSINHVVDFLGILGIQFSSILS